MPKIGKMNSNAIKKSTQANKQSGNLNLNLKKDAYGTKGTKGLAGTQIANKSSKNIKNAALLNQRSAIGKRIAEGKSDLENDKKMQRIEGKIASKSKERSNTSRDSVSISVAASFEGGSQNIKDFGSIDSKAEAIATKRKKPEMPSSKKQELDRKQTENTRPSQKRENLALPAEQETSPAEQAKEDPMEAAKERDRKLAAMGPKSTY